jgi:glutamine amidotransferase
MIASPERLVAYLANRTDRLHEVLYQERVVVAPPPAESARAWGIGFYQGDEVLHKKRPSAEGEVADVGAELFTDCAILHLNQPLLGAFRTQDVGPFRFRRWSYAQMGGEGSAALPTASLPDFLGRSVAGASTAERFFHHVLVHLHEAGALDHGDAPPEAVLSALRAVAADATRDAVDPFAAVMTSGERTFGLSCGRPIYHVHRRGIFDPIEPGRSPEGSKSIQLRYTLLVAGAPEAPPPPYEAMAADSIAIVERDLSVSVHSL